MYSLLPFLAEVEAQALFHARKGIAYTACLSRPKEQRTADKVQHSHLPNYNHNPAALLRLLNQPPKTTGIASDQEVSGASCR